MKTVTASFNTTVRQLTEMSQQKVTEMYQRKKKQMGGDASDVSAQFWAPPKCLQGPPNGDL